MYDKMKHIGSVVAKVFNKMENFLKPGITTKDIEIECVRLLKEQGAQSSCKGYRGFPGELCISINNEVCHGIPSSKRVIRKNDLVSIDIVANKDGYNGDSCVSFLIGDQMTKAKATSKTSDHCEAGTASKTSDHCEAGTASQASDSCVTSLIGESTNINNQYNMENPFIIGDASERAKTKILKATYECMWNAIFHIKAGIRIGDLGYLMESYANKLGYTVVRDFCGHGISVNMHEDPQVPFYGRRNTGETLKAGTCITIEPMLILGSPKVEILEDDWTAVTKGISCQFEHTVWIHENGYEVMTYNKYDANNGKIQSNV